MASVPVTVTEYKSVGKFEVKATEKILGSPEKDEPLTRPAFTNVPLNVENEALKAYEALLAFDANEDVVALNAYEELVDDGEKLELKA